MTSSDVVIIGGGIAGLAAAWELTTRGRRALVLERGGRPGGVILTERVDGFTIDGGPDALLIQKPAAIQLARELGLGDRLFPTREPRTAFVLRRRRLVPLPEASVLGIPTRVAPFLTSELFTWPGKLRMGLEVLVPPRPREGDESIGGFMRRRFGREAVTYLAEPLLAGIHAGDVDRLSMRSLFPRLLDAERSHGSVIRALRTLQAPHAPQGAFLSLPGGIGELVDTLVGRLPAETIRCGAEAARLEGSGPFVVHLEGGTRIEAHALIVAAPAWASAPLLSGLDTALGDFCRLVPYTSTATVVVGFRREQVRHPLRGSGFVVPRVERRALMAGSWVSSKWPMRAPEGTVLLRGFLGGAHDPDVLDRTDEALRTAVLEEFTELLGIEGAPMLSRVYRWPRGSAQHEVGHLERLARFDERLGRFPGLFVTGSGFRGLGIPDCVADARRVGAAAAAVLNGR
jgi:oxygen-dependent protoporphyrinogen oxidase